MDCKTFQKELPDLILAPDAQPSLAAQAHLKECPPCTEELESFQRTFAVLDTWSAPEPTPYFDQKMQVRLREEQQGARMGWFESLKTRFQFNTGRQFRPALAGALAVALVVGGAGSFVGLSHSAPPPTASATVNDLQILDRNAQAFDQLDQLQQDEEAPAQSVPDAAQSAQPIT
jgi:predicted anti-sigma-YlaC factor YlaD